MTLPPTDKTDKTDKTPAAVNEWGIPDWRDPAAYGDVKSWSFNRWRWEFYRRRDDVRAYFDAHADETYQCWQRNADTKWGKHLANIHIDDPGFVVTVDVETRARFGYAGLPNPRVGDQPHRTIWPYVTDDTLRIILTSFDNVRDLLAGCGVALTDRQLALMGPWLDAITANLGAHELAIVFDISRPLKPQLESSRILLQEEYDRQNKPSQRKRHPAKWLGYLRTLDARADGASWRKIAAIHPRTAGTQQAARDIWKAADALRFNF